MSIRIAALAAAMFAFTSVCSAQVAGPVFTASQSKACVPQENRRVKKQQELGEIQGRITRLHGAVAALEEGILLQQNIESQGQLHAAMGGTAGVARVTKAMSDTFLTLTEDYSPMTRFVKKTYDAFDALVAAGTGLYEGNGVTATANGLNTAQKGTEAYIKYLRTQPGLVILPQSPQTPGVVASAVTSAGDLRRGDYIGSASHLATGVEKLLDSKAVAQKGASRTVSKMLAGFADTPGKTMDSRFADELSAFGEVSKLAGGSGRILGNSGMMLEQVSRTKQGLGEAADMYREYKKIEERSTKAQAQFQRQIEKKGQEIARLEGDAYRIASEIREAELGLLSCRAAEETKLAKAESSKRPSAPNRGSSYERLDRTSWRSSSQYTGSSWDRQASRQRRERTMALRDLADRRARTSRPTGGYSSSQPHYEIRPDGWTPKTSTPRPPEPSSPGRRCPIDEGESGTVIADDGQTRRFAPSCGSH